MINSQDHKKEDGKRNRREKSSIGERTAFHPVEILSWQFFPDLGCLHHHWCHGISADTLSAKIGQKPSGATQNPCLFCQEQKLHNYPLLKADTLDEVDMWRV
jgi:hypothetical protein